MCFKRHNKEFCALKIVFIMKHNIRVYHKRLNINSSSEITIYIFTLKLNEKIIGKNHNLSFQPMEIGNDVLVQNSINLR